MSNNLRRGNRGYVMARNNTDNDTRQEPLITTSTGKIYQPNQKVKPHTSESPTPLRIRIDCLRIFP